MDGLYCSYRCGGAILKRLQYHTAARSVGCRAIGWTGCTVSYRCGGAILKRLQYHTAARSVGSYCTKSQALFDINCQMKCSLRPAGRTCVGYEWNKYVTVYVFPACFAVGNIFNSSGRILSLQVGVSVL
jgi:hypothetical protein